MIHLKDLNLFQGPEQLIREASLQIHDGWKVALIGPNGCGKSSLFSLLRKQHPVDSGDYSIPAKWRIAHMAQEITETTSPAIEYVLDGHPVFRDLEKQIAESQNQPDKLSRYLAEFEEIQGYQCRNLAEQLLSGLGFEPASFMNPVKSFSGGWRIRLNLARALMQPSDLLLLDEPTNHLDVEACIWLEKWLLNYKGTLIFVSHDQDFINNISDHIISFEQKELFLYTGNYATYEETRAQRLAQQQAAFNKQQERIQQVQSFITRFKAKASKAKQAQSRVKELERMELLAPAHVDSPFNFHFRQSDKVSSPLLRVDNINLGYGSEPVVADINLMISPGDRYGILGSNGAGKSTLIKYLSGQIRKMSGDEFRGQNLNIGYFAQHQLEALRADDSPLQHLQRQAPDINEQELKNFLGGFGFQGDKAKDPIAILSGGEKARLSLATIAWHKPNLLLLDEPTNHLDLETRHALTLALQEFEGAIILISHDRHLLRNTVDEYLLIRDGTISVFDGDLTDYYAQARQEDRLTATDNRKSKSEKERRRLEAEQRQALSPLRNSIRKLEQKLEKTDSALQETEAELSDPGLYEDSEKSRLSRILEKQRQLSEQKDSIEMEWMELSEELESRLNSAI